MRKIQLNLESLEVESFATTGAGAKKRGTVHGHSIYYTDNCHSQYGYPSCPGGASVPREGCIDSASGMHACICGEWTGTPECL